MNVRRNATCLAAVSIALSNAAAAWEDSYGSIAFSPTSGAVGYAWGASSGGEADHDALTECRKHARDCIIGISFWNACGAVALGRNRSWGVAWATDETRAQNLAMQYCRERTSGCRIIRWQCSLP